MGADSQKVSVRFDGADERKLRAYRQLSPFGQSDAIRLAIGRMTLMRRFETGGADAVDHAIYAAGLLGDPGRYAPQLRDFVDETVVDLDGETVQDGQGYTQRRLEGETEHGVRGVGRGPTFSDAYMHLVNDVYGTIKERATDRYGVPEDAFR